MLTDNETKYLEEFADVDIIQIGARTMQNFDLLKAVGKGSGIKIVSCPTCGRTRIDLIGLAKKVEKMTRDIDKNITVAVMGCVVNGIGEAGEADVGIAGGDGCVVLFKHGKKLCKLPEQEALKALMNEIDKL